MKRSLARRPGNLGEKVSTREHALAAGRTLARVGGFCLGGFIGLVISFYGVQAFGLIDWGQAFDPLDHPPPGDPDYPEYESRMRLIELLILAFVVLGCALGCLIAIRITSQRRSLLASSKT